MTKKMQHPDVIDVEVPTKPIETEEERAQRLAARRVAREHLKEKEEMEYLINEPRRWLQARALWSLYRRVEVIKQTIVIGSIRQEMLLSHKSIYSV